MDNMQNTPNTQNTANAESIQKPKNKKKKFIVIISIAVLILAMLSTASFVILSPSISLFSENSDDTSVANSADITDQGEESNPDGQNDYRIGLTGGPIESWEIVGSWYGKYKEAYFVNGVYKESFDADMNLSIDDCDEEGNLYGEGYSISVTEGDEYEGTWLRFSIRGKVDLETGKFSIEQVERIDGTYGVDISHEIYIGIIEGDSMEGVIENETYELGEDLTFSFGRVSKWAKDEITEANARGLIPATLQGKDLSQQITRAEFAAVSLALYESLTGEEQPDGSAPFTDIAGNEDEDSIKKAYILNIVNGVSDTKFEPLESISRQDLATMLFRTVKKYSYEEWTLETDSQYSFDYSGITPYADDEHISEYAKPAVYYLSKLGIITGVDEYNFAPQNTTSEETAIGYATATREQAIALSLRIYKMSDTWSQPTN